MTSAHHWQKLRCLKLPDLFGISPEYARSFGRRLLAGHDFHYRTIEGVERDKLLIDILLIIDREQMARSGNERNEAWEKGWSENLVKFNRTGVNLTALIPGYIKPGHPLRLLGGYIRSADANFLWNLYTVYRQMLFRKYLADYNQVYEFGCGTATNLALLAEIFPAKIIHGTDWTKSSLKIIDELRRRLGYNVQGKLVDMFNPDQQYRIESNSAVITLNAMEQLGERFEPFLAYLLKKRPALCLNCEPFYELYDPHNLTDYLAMRYHEKRGYLINYLPRLRELEKQRKIEIIKIHRVRFGVLLHEAYSYVVWRPL